jgi:speckle-type POZ protein
MPGGKLVAVDHVGREQVVVREQMLSEMHTIRVVFHDFEKLPHKRCKSTKSSASLCHGSQWQLRLYPGGDCKSNSNTVYTSLHLQCVFAELDDRKVKAKFAFRVPSTNYSKVSAECLFDSDGAPATPAGNFLLRSDVLDPSKDFLVDGNLIIEVDIQVYKDASPFWEPKSELNVDMMKVLESAKESGDVTFQVGPQEFSAHRGILEVRAPVLAALTEDCPSNTPIQIQGVKPSVFRSLLRFVYANEVEDLRNEARQLLDVADRFGCKGLKLVAEAELVASGILVDTAADLVLLGDAKNCALLKEAAMEFFAKNAESVISSSGWAKVTESLPLMKELMEVLVTTHKKRLAPDNPDEERDCKRMRVSTLRRMLDEKGLDVDGSRDVLISRLEEVDNDDGSDNAHVDNESS